MAMAMVETWVNQDLKEPVRMNYPKGNLYSDDNLGNLVGVRAFSDGLPASLSGSVVGYCVLATGAAIPVSGTLSDNTAYIVLPDSAYSVPGLINIIIKITSGSTVTTLAAICMTVVGVGSVVSEPSAAVIEEWTAQINAAIATVQSNSVRFDTSQSLTTAQKTQARSNMGATFSVVQIDGDNYKVICP